MLEVEPPQTEVDPLKTEVDGEVVLAPPLRTTPYRQSLWTAPKRAKWGRSDADLLENFRDADWRDFEALRTLRRRELMADVEARDHDLSSLRSSWALNAVRDEPGTEAMRGALCSLRHDDRGASAHFDKSLSQDSRVLRALSGRGSVRMRTGNAHLALSDFDAAVKARDDAPLLLAARGEAHLASGDSSAALADFEQVLHLDPKGPRSWSSRAMAKLGIEDLGGAVADCSHSLELDSKSSETLCIRARARLAADDIGGALFDLNAAVRLEPTNSSLLLERAKVRNLPTSGHSTEGVLSDLDRALSQDPSCSEAWLLRAKIVSGRDRQEAIRDLTRAIEATPVLAEAWIRRGHARLDEGDTEGGITDLETGVGLKPSEVDMYLPLAEAKFRQGRFLDAITVCEQALRLDPEYTGPVRKLLQTSMDMEARLKAFKFDPLPLSTPRRKGQDQSELLGRMAALAAGAAAAASATSDVNLRHGSAQHR